VVAERGEPGVVVAVAPRKAGWRNSAAAVAVDQRVHPEGVPAVAAVEAVPVAEELLVAGEATAVERVVEHTGGTADKMELLAEVATEPELAAGAVTAAEPLALVAEVDRRLAAGLAEVHTPGILAVEHMRIEDRQEVGDRTAEHNSVLEESVRLHTAAGELEADIHRRTVVGA